MPARSLLEKLEELYPESNRTRFRQWISTGRISVDGNIVTDPRTAVTEQSEITIGGKTATTTSFRGGRIVFEDADLIVVDKQAGMLSVPAPGSRKEQTLYGSIERHLRKTPYIVHRLDRDTSGLIVFAKTEAAQKELQRNWNESVEERIYLALVEGELFEQRGTLRSYLKENKAQKMYATQDGDGALAILHYTVLRSGRPSLVQIELETGRKNQIRAQFEEIGHPVVGDAKYGAKTDPLRRLALHAHTIRFRHPVTGESLAFTSPPPPSFD